MQPHLLYFNKHEKMLLLADWRFSNSLLYIVPKTNRNLRMKTEPVIAGACALCNGICLVSRPETIKQKPDIL